MAASRKNKEKATKAQALVLLDLLREMREERGLLQQELAEALGKPQSFVSKIESGSRRLDILELRAVCTACGTRLSDFVQRLERRL